MKQNKKNEKISKEASKKAGIKLSKKSIWIISIASVLLIAIVGVVVFLGRSSGKAEEQITTIKIETAYGTMEFPERFKENLKHQEVVEGSSTSEIFSMVNGETEIEICRIIFGNENKGDLIGYYDETPVTLLVYSYGGVKFPDEETRQIYFSMMDNINVLIDSMRKNGRFQTGGVPNFVNNAAQMKYWKINIPNAMEWEETTDGGIYKVTFYGTFNGVRISLYTISLDDKNATEIVGNYKVDGVSKPLSVEITGMSQVANIPEEDRTVAYAMMDTINDVLNEIRQNENFSNRLDAEG